MARAGELNEVFGEVRAAIEMWRLSNGDQKRSWENTLHALIARGRRIDFNRVTEEWIPYLTDHEFNSFHKQIELGSFYYEHETYQEIEDAFSAGCSSLSLTVAGSRR